MRVKKLQNRIAILLFVMTSAVSLAGLFWLFGGVSREAVNMNASLQFSNLDIAENNITNLLKATENAALSCFYNEQAKSYVLETEPQNRSLDARRSMQNALYSAVNAQPAIGDIVIFRRDGASISSNGSIQYPYYSYESCLNYYQQRGVSMDAIENYSVWTSLGQDYLSGKYCLVNIRKLHNPDTHDDTAVMLVLIKEKAIRELFSFFGEGSYLVNTEGTVISAADGMIQNRSIADETFFKEIKSEKSTGPQHYVSQEDTRFCVPIPQLSAWLVAVPDAGVLNTVQSSFSGMLVTALGFILGCSVLAAVFLSKGIVKPVHKLAAAMKKARNGNFSVRCDVGGPDEIRYLGSTFNTLMDDIERYVAEVTQKEKEKRAYELRFLQAQINPHLLYNSLDSVLAYLASNDTRHAEEILMQLSGFFKIALHRGGTFVELGQEVEHVRKYMELQRLCRGKLIDLQVNIPEPLLHMPVMRTTLQPIVENSFMHAFLGSVNDGTICIEAKTIEDGRYVALSVTDDGLGMDAESIRSVMANLDNSDFPAEKGGFGLKNVNRRLKSCYGDRYGLTIESVLGEFTKVMITLPAEGENPNVPIDDRG